MILKTTDTWDAWLAQSVEHATLDLRVVSLGPTCGVEFTYNKKLKKKKE